MGAAPHGRQPVRTDSRRCDTWLASSGGLDAIVSPGGTGYEAAAIAGYPSLSVPVGFALGGLPAGLCFTGGFLAEPLLLALAYDLEQELGDRRLSGFEGAPPPEPGDAGLCTAGIVATRHFRLPAPI